MSATNCWNYAEAIYQLAQSTYAEKAALIHGNNTISYRELLNRALGIASYLDSFNLPAGSHVGHYLRNSNAYMETFFGAALAGHSHVNVNYRYNGDELADLCNGLDIRVLVYDSEFADTVASIRDRLPETKVFIEVDGAAVGADSGADCIQSFAMAFSELQRRDSTGFERKASGDDLILIATGGTTGLPKGTQWRHEDLWGKTETGYGGALNLVLGVKQNPANMEDHAANVNRLPGNSPFLSLSPLMHGAGMIMALVNMAQGNPLVTIPGVKFDADTTLSTISKEAVGGLVLVGDAFALPLIEALERRAEEHLLSSLRLIVSSGASLSVDSKANLRKHKPELIILDTLGSSEALRFGVSTPEAGVFSPLPTTRILDDNLEDVTPGSETVGMIYSGGFSPIGYYNEPEKSAESFVEINGERFVKTGDRCTVRDDGMIVLLGRDSTVINTGGEKVYTVEVENTLLSHPAIDDALVVGISHPRFGKEVVAVIQGQQLSAGNFNVEDLDAHCRRRLAHYKIPRQFFVIDDLKRAPNGKPDYPFVIAFAEAQQASTQGSS